MNGWRPVRWFNHGKGTPPGAGTITSKPGTAWCDLQEVVIALTKISVRLPFGGRRPKGHALSVLSSFFRFQ